MERKIVSEFLAEPEGRRDRLLQNHRIRGLVDAMQERAAKLRRIYEDANGARAEEAAQLGAQTPEGRLSKFAQRLGEVRDYYRRFPSYEFSEGGDVDPLALIPEPRVEFTGEERWGQTLDLYELHHDFVNARFGRAVDYVSYVQDLADFSGVPRARRLEPGYLGYLNKLVGYLESFYARTQPLVNAARNYRKLEDEFARDWEAGEVEGWEDRGLGGAAAEPLVDLESFESVGDVEALGGDALKEALDALGLKAGGTVAERAARLWKTRGVALADLPRGLFQKGRAPVADPGGKEAERREARARAVALLETKAAKLCEVMAAAVEATVHFAEKKQVQTYEELEREREDERAGEDVALEDEEDAEEDVYNPWKIPLGWDGKPLPVWLYKLHGLNIEFKCEICGEASYWGRRAYEQHFNEWRHVQGLRSLGIRMSKEFYEVTSIKEAQALWDSLRKRQRGGFNADADEEFEDEDGNVYNKKTFEDLKRQGII